MNPQRLYKIILSTYMSEKASLAQMRGEYVFKVIHDADKNEIKQAIEFVFKTKVDCVRVLNVKPKPKTFGKIKGKSKAWKKAYVTLQEGQEIKLPELQA